MKSDFKKRADKVKKYLDKLNDASYPLKKLFPKTLTVINTLSFAERVKNMENYLNKLNNASYPLNKIG